MVEFFKTVDGRITEVSEFTEGCWVNMVHPSSDELEQIAQAAQVEEEFVRAALDPEESSRVDTEDEQLLMIVDIPMVEKSSVEDSGQMFTTIPMGIVVAQNAVITVCLEDSIILRSIAEGAVKGVHTSLKTRFVFQILLRIAGRFLKNLRMIERDFTRIEMANIYSNIMAGTMDAYASVVSNNLNIIMKVLTILTIIMTIPNIVFGFFGMNIGEGRIPGDWVWWMPLAITVVGCFFAWWMLKKKNLD